MIFFKKMNTELEVSLILLLKATIILFIWWAFFSHPLQAHLNDQKATAHLLA